MTSYATMSRTFNTNANWKRIDIDEFSMTKLCTTPVMQDRLGRLAKYGVLQDIEGNSIRFYLCVRLHERADLLDSMIRKHGRGVVNNAYYFCVTPQEAKEFSRMFERIDNSDEIPVGFHDLLRKVYNRTSGTCDVDSLDAIDKSMWMGNKLIHAVAYYHVDCNDSNKLRAVFYPDQNMTTSKAIVSHLNACMK